MIIAKQNSSAVNSMHIDLLHVYDESKGAYY